MANKTPLTGHQERRWAKLAHLSILLNPLTLVLGALASLLIYLKFRRRSRYIGYQALQSLLFQLIVWFGVGAVALMAWFLVVHLENANTAVFFMPLAGLLTLIPPFGIIYALYAASLCGSGLDFQYWKIGKLADRLYHG